MRIKLALIISFYVMWLVLVGIPTNLLVIFFALTMPIAILMFTMWFSLVPEKNRFNLKIIGYIFWLIKEILIAAVNVVRIAWRPNLVIKPALEPLKTMQKTNAGLVLYANSITLTPGTIAINTKNKNLLIHALDVSSIEELKEGEMDRRVKEVIIR